MAADTISLTQAEWSVMECLWDGGPLTGRQVTQQMAECSGWSRSTTLTLLSRLENKGALERTPAEKGPALFSPILKREDAALGETKAFLDRVYQGSLRLMVSALTQKQALSRRELNELHELLNGLEAEQHD